MEENQYSQNLFGSTPHCQGRAEKGINEPAKLPEEISPLFQDGIISHGMDFLWQNPAQKGAGMGWDVLLHLVLPGILPKSGHSLKI